MSWSMPGEGLNIGSRTRRLQVPLLRFSKPTIVREWPGGGEFGDGWGGGGGGGGGGVRRLPGCWKYKGGSEVRQTFRDGSLVPLRK